MKSQTKLENTLMEELKDTYDAEVQLTQALPKVIKAVEHYELKSALEAHLEETKGHVMRLENIFQILGEKPQKRKCKAMHGILAEGEDLIHQKAGDAAIVGACQKVEHYEMASYMSLISWAELIGEDEVAEILHETLEEEQKADDKLRRLAENSINMDDKLMAKAS